jgi:enoyl-CoA hydratase/carnithine racemase
VALDPAYLESAGLRLDITTQEPLSDAASSTQATAEPAQQTGGTQAAGGYGSGETSAAAGTVATVTLIRPRRRNAMTPGMWRGLAAIGRELPPQVRVVVVKGAGESFSAGIDLRLFTAEGVRGEDPLPDLRSESFPDWIAGVQAGFTWLRDPRIISIAAVHGHAIGAGFQLALSCDLRVFADDAKVCMKEPALGLVPDLTGTKPLVDLVGLPRALEVCLTARTIEAREARELGLAEIVVPAADLDAAVADLTAALLAIDPATARATKRLLSLAPSNTLEQQAAAEARIQAELQREKSG